MNELRWTELAAHVVAWHNRNPLARRIGVQHVLSLGYVMLPFAPTTARAAMQPQPARATPDGLDPLPPEAMTGSLRERAMARAQLNAQEPAGPAIPHVDTTSPLRPAFDEDFIPPHTPESVRRWAARHAVAQTTPRGEVLVRKLRPEAGLPDSEVLPRWALTAQIDTGQARSRVLVGPGTPPAVLGRRQISPLRSVALLVLVGALLGVIHGLVNRPSTGLMLTATPTAHRAPAAASAAAAPPVAPATAGAAAVAASGAAPVAASSASAAAPAPPTTPAVAAPPVPASGVLSSERPLDVEPRLGKVDLPSLGPRADERRRRAQEAAAAAASASAPRATPHATPPPAAPQPRPAAMPPPTGHSFAVATRLLRTRSESEQVAAAMRELLSKQPGSAVRVEVLPAGDDWRVVGWPYTDRAGADQAQALLTSRGMKVQVIDF